MNRLYLPILLALILAFSACSSPPKLVQAPAKGAADATLKLANTLEMQQKYGDSKLAYRSSIDQYGSFGDVKGQLYSMAGLARIAHFEGREGDLLKLRQKMDFLGTEADPFNNYINLLLELYLQQAKGNYQTVANLAEDSYDYPIDARVQILTYKLQAESYLREGFGAAEYENLSRLSKRYQRALRTDFTADPSVLSGALYAMAYHKYLAMELQTAAKHANQAKDLDFLHENFPGMAYDLWLLGQIRLRQGEKSRALSDFLRAKMIFERYENVKMIQKCDAEIERIRR